VEHFYESVNPGWFDYQDIFKRAIAEAKDGDILVEVGCWHGKSSAFLEVEALNSGKRLEIYHVDIWEQAPGLNDGKVEVPCDKEQWIKNMKPLLARGIGLHPIQLPSLSAAKQFDDGSVAFCFIDADHSFESVKADIAAWLPKMKPGGLLAGHDYIPDQFPGVVQAVMELPAYAVQGNSWLYRVPG
jgi:cephalosporin hydroxylase